MPTTDPPNPCQANVDSNSQQTILIIGASARYIAQSAKIAGLHTVGASIFLLIGTCRKSPTFDEFPDCPGSKLTNLYSFAADASGFLIAGGMEIREAVLQCLQADFAFFGPEIDQISTNAGSVCGPARFAAIMRYHFLQYEMGKTCPDGEDDAKMAPEAQIRSWRAFDQKLEPR